MSLFYLASCVALNFSFATPIQNNHVILNRSESQEILLSSLRQCKSYCDTKYKDTKTRNECYEGCYKKFGQS